MKTNAEHPAESMLVLALDNELDRQEADAILDHVSGCDGCRKTFEEFRRLSEQIVNYHQTLRIRRPARRHVLPYVAAAAVFLLATSAWYWMKMSDRPVTQPVQVVAKAVEPVKIESPAVPAVHRVQRRPSHTSAVFIALPFSDSALPLTDARVVRAKIPIEELRLTGLTVEPAPKGASIEADVLIGIDGLPRGIRFVQ